MRGDTRLKAAMQSNLGVGASREKDRWRLRIGVEGGDKGGEWLRQHVTDDDNKKDQGLTFGGKLEQKNHMSAL
ncbi:hypothetical protein GUJ93_ZPchr0004g38422 [Zizania palustris]|uniref:Uncharacterized protein n=1 Tax=Zizania palustris TaxID=103762 RepID=A0A8J5SXA0_ZIZPA|nr:hypothetical protein GUJ93_ZPchr0004g38422 [Zizania palustris]